MILLTVYYLFGFFELGKGRSNSPLPDVTGDQPPPIGQTVDIIREEPMVIEDGKPILFLCFFRNLFYHFACSTSF